MSSPLSLLFSRLNMLFAQLLLIYSCFLVFHQPCWSSLNRVEHLNILVVSCLKLNTELEVWSYPGDRGQSLPYPCWPHFFWYKSECLWSTWSPGHTTGSLLFSWLLTCNPRYSFLGCFPATLLQACTTVLGSYHPVQCLAPEPIYKW